MAPGAIEHGPSAKRTRHDPDIDSTPAADMEVDEAPAKRDVVYEDFEGYSPQLMQQFYRRLFPFPEMVRWLSYGHKKNPHPMYDENYLQRREISMTLDGDIFVRYQSFKNADEMAKTIRARNPLKIDIGAVFNVDPAKRNAYSSFGAVERELVFDVDMTDYDDVRTCCTGADICKDCWPLMTIAIKVVDHILREDLGYQHILWVYSGRRGVHCWVCDEKARKLTNEQRGAITDYLKVYKGSENNKEKKVSLQGSVLHPMLSRAYREVLLPAFLDQVLPRQNLLVNETQIDTLLAMIPDEELAEEVKAKWRNGGRRASAHEDENLARWKDLEKIVIREKKRNIRLGHCLEEIVFAYTYPRLDLEVSKHMNHLLKAPFCVHPKTGKVCVPIDPADCDNFDPMGVPTLASLLNEVQRFRGDLREPAEEAAEAALPTDLDKTSLKEAVQLFRTTFLDDLEADCKSDIERAYRAKKDELASRPTTGW
ncbi:DNA primase catalytic (small) subunit [Klebsormidium nitens]|uniref:DNA primase n=1 Tax=Klebsormidium nitens TaxID=105231 RepID=A0A1Y1I2W9_KLENI|nr:DNA primase catalytic (small) subunit [Klebsormidium nitens]|eukprot:GAQ83086.1 DNA primase catalytic (small) subunit [Klebsormidium nitens]